ncbi:AMIN-like domain-containing (lipo)protein [Amnibacterium kyonggiense]|uniref:AMIN-like domain-containing protein n=1 Tax=Amnibacterium kyonggiense TaxID=595671 RepID=A0A4R7FKJ3_9MICO|nr:hypothetical protein [Amnibacterium kyonggiense]TDS76880.1 hypothetical protein CLV52_1819 [Amnibacterium kyonggiense]
MRGRGGAVPRALVGVLSASVLVVALAGCGGAAPRPTVTRTVAVPTTATPAPTTAAPSPSGGATPTGGGPTVLRSHITHGWGVPTAAAPFRTTHRIVPPIAPPPAPPLPCLRSIGFGLHHAEGYEQLSFRFTGAMPGSDIRYVAADDLVADPSGRRLPVRGDRALRITFRDAQAHGEDGASTVVAAPTRPLRGDVLRDLVRVGDSEGVVTVGVGVGGPDEGGGAPRVRVVEVERIEAGVHRFVVAVQVALH